MLPYKVIILNDTLSNDWMYAKIPLCIDLEFISDVMKRILQAFSCRWSASSTTLSFLRGGSREVRRKLINVIIHARVFIPNERTPRHLASCAHLHRQPRFDLRVYIAWARKSDKNRFVTRLYLSRDSVDRRSPHDEKSCFRSEENRSVSGRRFVPSSMPLRLIERVLKKVLSKM